MKQAVAISRGEMKPGCVFHVNPSIDAKLPMAVKETIDSAASKKPRNVIAEHQLAQLTLRDQKLLAEALADDTIKEPDDFLTGLAREYREKVKSE